MESEDSRPGSSASTSSSNSSNNSRQSSPMRTNEDGELKSPIENTVVSSQSSSGRRSRPHSRSSNGEKRSPRSPSNSNSSSSSSSNYNENDDEKSMLTAVASQSNKSSSAGSSSDEGDEGKSERVDLHNRSTSTGNSGRISRNSSNSSNGSRSNSPLNNHMDAAVNINHEDLSDVSDMESEKRGHMGSNSKQSLEDEGTNTSVVTAGLLEDEADISQSKWIYASEGGNSQDGVITDLRQKLDQKKNQVKVADNQIEPAKLSGVCTTNGSSSATEPLEVLVKSNDEDALDFEAEEGECQDVSKEAEKSFMENNSNTEKDKNTSEKSDGEAEEGEELEEGEVSDEDEKRPEETEPKPICRFYTRGQCTWGMSCRFLHPGVTDKGNYTMFDLVRPVPVTQTGNANSRSAPFGAHVDYHDYRTDRPSLHHRGTIHHTASVYATHHDPRSALPPEGPVVVESAWERGLRTAKEMMRKANKRKEQDMDFEDKKMNLTLSPDEMEKDSYYLKDRGSPTEAAPSYGRHGVYQESINGMYSPPDRFGRGPPVPTAYEEVDPYGRTTRYRELPPHRMPQYEDERRVRPTREVIVQRVEPVGRGDEWRDPWMRSPGGRGESRDHGEKRRRERSYSSNSSYSTSSSSQSDSSSDSSRSPSPVDHRRRYNSNSHKSPPISRKHGMRSMRSPSPVHRRPRRSPSIRQSSLKRRGHISPLPAVEKRSAHSPSNKRKKISPSSKKTLNEKLRTKRRHTSSSSGSGSSESSASDSGSESESTSSDSSSGSGGHASTKIPRNSKKILNDRKAVKQAEQPKKRSPISIEIKKPAIVGASALASSPTHSISSEKDSKKSRREELLKQLRAVEDAIAKKRSKLA